MLSKMTPGELVEFKRKEKEERKQKRHKSKQKV